MKQLYFTILLVALNLWNGYGQCTTWPTSNAVRNTSNMTGNNKSCPNYNVSWNSHSMEYTSSTKNYVEISVTKGVNYEFTFNNFVDGENELITLFKDVSGSKTQITSKSGSNGVTLNWTADYTGSLYIVINIRECNYSFSNATLYGKAVGYDSSYVSQAISSHPSDKSVCSNSSTNFTVSTAGETPSSYKWQYSTNGGTTYTDVPNSPPYSGVTSATLNISNVTGLNNY